MGFLGDLFAKKAKEIFDDKLGDTVVGKVLSDSDVDSRTHSYNENKSERKRSSVSDEWSRDGVIERLKNVCGEKYSEYELVANVDASIFNADSKASNYSYVMYKDSKPCLTIMILEGHNDYRLKRVELAHEASEAFGVGCINIMTFLPSTTEYIEGRIKEYLN